MHSTMPEILPAIAEEDGDTEPRRRFQNQIHHLGDPHLPRRKAARRVPVEEKRLDHHGVGDHGRLDTSTAATATGRASTILQGLAKGPRIDAYARQNQQDGPASLTDPAGPDRDVVLLLSVEIPGVGQIINSHPQRGLDDLLHEHGTQDFGGGDAVTLFELGGRVEAVLGEVVFGGNDLEDEGHEPVGCDGEEEGEVEVGEVGEEGAVGVECVWKERGKGGCLVGHDDLGLICA